MSLQRAWLPTAILISLIAAGANPVRAQDARAAAAGPELAHASDRPTCKPGSRTVRQRPRSLLLTSQPLSASLPRTKPTPCPPAPRFCLQLRSAINTKSAKPGDGVYLSSTFPVVVGNRVMIPAGVYVQGVVDRVQRGGRIKGKAQLDMHFTSIIFPNGSVVEIPGVVNSVPGAKNQTVKDRRRGNHPAERRQGPERGPGGRDRASDRRRRRHHRRSRVRASD